MHPDDAERVTEALRQALLCNRGVQVRLVVVAVAGFFGGGGVVVMVVMVVCATVASTRGRLLTELRFQ